MSLHRRSNTAMQGSWLAIAAMAIAALAVVQLVIGSKPIVWLLVACVALWGLLAQASRSEDSRPIRMRPSYHRSRSAGR